MGSGSREKILGAARDLFYRNGYLATSVDDILSQAVVSKSNFYYHYKSKEDLGLAVLTRRCLEFEQALADSLGNRDLSPLERLQGFLDLLRDTSGVKLAAGCPFGNLVVEMSEHSERFRHELTRMFGELSALVTQVVEEGQQAGQIRTDVDAETVAVLIVQSVQGAQLMIKCHKTRESFLRALELVLYLIQAA